MIYVQLRARVKLAQGETLHVADAAKVLGSEKAGHCSLFCPTSPGVYTLDAIAVAKALKKVFPQEDISLIGAEVCYVHRIKARGKDFLRPVRTAAALLILLLGSALGLTWFHADVNMPQAQADVYAAIPGAPPDDVRLITIRSTAKAVKPRVHFHAGITVCMEWTANHAAAVWTKTIGFCGLSGGNIQLYDFK